ncbi:MAG TPA: hypothetical protein VFD25_04805 [Clostridia bacterium]|nr:hypothetical protein [Clostridia bacterium]
MKKGKTRTFKSSVWKALNIFIITNFLAEIFYGTYQIFFVLLPPDGKKGPLMSKAKSVSPELMTKRRLFAIETWVAFSGLSVYLAALYKDKLTGKSEKK